jgi:hypothetical protein
VRRAAREEEGARAVRAREAPPCVRVRPAPCRYEAGIGEIADGFSLEFGVIKVRPRQGGVGRATRAAAAVCRRAAGLTRC